MISDQLPPGMYARDNSKNKKKLFKLNFKSVLWTRGFIIQKGDDPHIYFKIFILYTFEIDTNE